MGTLLGTFASLMIGNVRSGRRMTAPTESAPSAATTAELIPDGAGDRVRSRNVIDVYLSDVISLAGVVVSVFSAGWAVLSARRARVAQ